MRGFKRYPSDYIEGGCWSEATLRENNNVLKKIRIVPRVLRDVSHVCTETSDSFGDHRMPIGISPTAFHKLVTSDGELATAKAANSVGIPYIVSCYSSINQNTVAAAIDNGLYWQQLYFFEDRDMTKRLIETSEELKASAIVVTVGTPVSGKRMREINGRWKVPESLSFRTKGKSERTIGEIVRCDLRQDVVWSDIKDLVKSTTIPVILKGVLDSEDAKRAGEVGVSGLILSNHGGRQLEDAVMVYDVIDDIKEAVEGQIPLFVDGGIRTGHDVTKALVAGASRVFVGREILRRLYVSGEKGLTRFLLELKEDLINDMKLCGCNNINDVSNLKRVWR